MKIEKLSDNQIRCTLKKSDLTSRHLKVSELAYGSEKAKELFREIINQASYEFGFEADDIPLMIEAIPISADCIVLIVTKVDEPDELDTRFSKFSPDEYEDDEYDYPFDEDFETLPSSDSYDDFYDDSDDVPTASEELELSPEEIEASDSIAGISSDEAANKAISIFNQLRDYINKNLSNMNEVYAGFNGNSAAGVSDYNTNQSPSDSADFIPFKDSYNNSKTSAKKARNISTAAEPVIRVFNFRDFNTFSNSVDAIHDLYDDNNSLYKDPKSGIYYLALEQNICAAADFNKTCNILSEYAVKENANRNRIHFFDEHYECIIKNNAIQTISQLS